MMVSRFSTVLANSRTSYKFGESAAKTDAAELFGVLGRDRQPSPSENLPIQCVYQLRTILSRQV